MASKAAAAMAPAREAAPRRVAAEAAAEQSSQFDRKRAQGLFAKMTSSAARALQAASLTQEQGAAIEGTERREERVLPSLRLKAAAQNAAQANLKQASQVKITPAQRPLTTSSKSKAEPQPRLGLDSAQSSVEPAAEEDLLDIPAFLRRQAN
jgi:cell division protein FtsZ